MEELAKVIGASRQTVSTLINVLGSETVTDLALNGLEELVGASFVVEPDPLKAAELLDVRIFSKRSALGLTD